MDDSDELVTSLSTEIRGAIGQCKLKFNEDQYDHMIGVVTVALAYEVAWFKHFVVEGNDVPSLTFDRVFREKTLKYYEQFKRE